jgi:hypothetical protein
MVISTYPIRFKQIGRVFYATSVQLACNYILLFPGEGAGGGTMGCPPYCWSRISASCTSTPPVR